MVGVCSIVIGIGCDTADESDWLFLTNLPDGVQRVFDSGSRGDAHLVGQTQERILAARADAAADNQHRLVPQQQRLRLRENVQRGVGQRRGRRQRYRERVGRQRRCG